MIHTKACDFCGVTFEKKQNCSMAEWPKKRFCSRACKHAAQLGQPNKSKGIPRKRTAAMHPCRICGKPTKYRASLTANTGLVHCEKPECIEASRLLKNERIKETALRKYASGERAKVRHTWVGVSRISKEEVIMAPWFTSQGWDAQHRVLTGVHTNMLPRQFHLDFALPERKLYVEIDGDVHRLRQDRDARRDQMLAERGWTGLRLPADLVLSDLDAAVHRVTSWLDSLQYLAA